MTKPESQPAVCLVKVLPDGGWLLERYGTYFRLSADDVRQIATLTSVKGE